MDSKEIIKKETDFTQEETSSLQEWKDNNKPGLTSITQDKVFQWFRLYMSGKTYSEIAKMTNSKKNLILFASERNNWLKLKMDHYSDITNTMVQKYKETKLKSLNTMTTMINALNDYFGSKFDKYLKTNDESHLQDIDSKMLSQYQKANESIDKMMAEITGESSGESGRGRSNTPTININMNGNSSVHQVGDDTIDVTPSKEEDVKEILENLSKLKKARSSDKN